MIVKSFSTDHQILVLHDTVPLKRIQLKAFYIVSVQVKKSVHKKACNKQQFYFIIIH